MSVIPPPLPLRAPPIIAQVREAEAALAALEAKTPMLALARAELQPGAAKAYSQHEAALAAARADLEGKLGAAEAAADLDRQAAAERSEMFRQADPDDLLVGISARDCCDACSANECVLLAGRPQCAHPRKGAIPHELMADPVIRGLRTAATEEIAALERGDYDDEDDAEDEEEEQAA